MVIAVGGLVSLISLARGEPLRKAGEVALAGALGVAPVALGLIVTVSFTYRISLFRDGVASYNPWGSWKREFLAWSAMATISRERLLGLGYLRICSADGKSEVWVPTVVNDQQRFVALVLQLGGSENVLAQALAGVPPGS
jgi:hypothetical protein